MIDRYRIYIKESMFEGSDNCANDPDQAGWDELHEGEH